MFKLITIPFAGDIGYSFKGWKKSFSPNVQVSNVVYPGRGPSLKEDYANSWGELVDDVYSQIVEEISDCEYGIFAHSMGGTVLYDIYYRLIEHNQKRPKFIIFSGIDTPDIPEEELSGLSEEDFKNYFIELGGIDKEVLEDKEMCEYFFEILRSDIELIEQYVYSPQNDEINCPVIIMNGREDSIKSKKNEWEKFLNKSCEYIEFDGGHFYLFQNNKEVIDKLKDIIKKHI